MRKNSVPRFFDGSLRPFRVFLWIAAAIVCACIVYITQNKPLPDGTVEIRFLDVGQGDASFIITEEGCILIDTGEAPAQQEVYFSVNSFGNRLEYLIITHAHTDHMGGAAYILEKMDVGTVILPRTICPEDSYVRFLDAVGESGAAVLFAEPGVRFTLGGAEFQVLAPTQSYEEENNRSAVIRMDFGRTSALFTGDAEALSEEDQLKRYSSFRGCLLDTDILKVPHHGSSTSSTDLYLKAVSPRFAVISCGRDNTYGHPADEVVSRLESLGAKILRTDLSGTVSLITDGAEIRLAS
ncbi:MAG: MBL fold metallo-hydrolase [Ruminococcaceae bacterium]|nr:MBL fold metallo-hydrolase [Oscillospiraceae bacterium]